MRPAADGEDFGRRRGDGQDAANGNKKSSSKLEDWYLAVHLLLRWDDQKSISALEMEDFLSKFLEGDAEQKYSIVPRTSSWIFLRGVLRTLWDIDRILRNVNHDQEEELKRVTASNPLLLSILRVLAYELMWMPEGDMKQVEQDAEDLVRKCQLAENEDRDWILKAVVRMRVDFDKASKDWERRKRHLEQRKRRERDDEEAEPDLIIESTEKRRRGVESAAKEPERSVAAPSKQRSNRQPTAQAPLTSAKSMARPAHRGPLSLDDEDGV